MTELSKAYEPKQYEDAIYKKWEESGLFNPDVCVEKGVTEPKSEHFSIVLPPPNVTGTLHMGHAAMLAIEDVMVRYHRMKGDRTLWVPGTDHAAIATQAKVEKLLIENEGKTKYDLGRPEFLKRVEKFAQESHDTIVNQARKMGASLDWSREAYTLDEKRNLAVRTVFKKMYDDGLIYRGHRIVNWDPKGQTVISDDEIVYEERKNKFYTFKYGPFEIGTARPETKFGDKYVVMHPDDKRYKKWKHMQKITVEWINAPIEATVIKDPMIDMEFGTGVMTITPWHSHEDFALAEKYKLDKEQIIDKEGKLLPIAQEFSGMKITEAKDKIVEKLKTKGLLVSVDENYINRIATAERTGGVVEPQVMEQWFVNVNKPVKERGNKTLKELMQDVVKNKKIEIVPDHFEKTYFHWIDNLRDWCISRQIWFGHQIPVWYKGEEVYVGVDAPAGDGWQQDSDTLDTWFSSGLWTFSTLGYPDLKAEDLKNYHPTSVMETGYDILFFWVARMILMTTYVLGDVPFKTVYLHGLVRDEQGRKMSKSLGNVINPLDMIAKYGTDATRLSLLLGNTPGNDMKLSEEKIAGFRNFTNKLWNISRFMLLNIEEPKIDVKEPKAKTLADEWILESLEIMKSLVEGSIVKYNFAIAGEMLKEFTWNHLADWYLEIAKVEGGKSEILNYILNNILKLWHPYMPFVTESIWQEVYGEGRSLMVEKWPSSVHSLGSFGDERNVDFLIVKEVIEKIRSLRAEYKIEPAKKIGAKINIGKKEKVVKDNEDIIKALARLEKLEFVESGAEIALDLAGAVDVEKEKPRLEKEIAEIKKYVTGLENKVSNKEFVDNAPKAVVEKEQEKLSEAQSKLAKLQEQLANLK
ncbi:MAG: valine--tRNA ligase [Candidatus Magasanikbacteria bacterium]|nr:valine--tRNA ligase [Candidatus Magasanikbacteria bacterium]